MSSFEERVAWLEGRVQEQGAFMADLRGVGAELRESVRDLRQGIDRLREDMDRRFEGMDQKIDRHFTWMVGMLVGALMGLIGLAFQIARLQPL